MTFNSFLSTFHSSQKKKNRCAVLASLDREGEEPYYAWAWKGASHPSVPGEDTKLTVMRLVVYGITIHVTGISVSVNLLMTNLILKSEYEFEYEYDLSNLVLMHSILTFYTSLIRTDSILFSTREE